MKLGSLFDGISAFPLAAQRHGITAVWASEIEPFPIQVSKRHFPSMKHLGSVTDIHGGKIEPVDIMTAGSPCQDLSVAGKRAGLEGARSGLFMEFIRIVREMRDATAGKYPRFIIWENVPGAFSSNGGQDFRAVLEEISQTEIPMPASGKWAEAGMVRVGEREIAWRVLNAQYWGVPQRRKRIFLVADFRGHLAGEILFLEQGLRGDSQESRKEREEVAQCITAGTGRRYDPETETLIPVLFEPRSQDGVPRIHSNGICPTLNTMQGGQRQPCVAAVDVRNLYETPELSRTLQAKNTGGYSLNYQNPVRVGYAVRRLTPTECERLMGFPDDWTAGGSDTVRYKALGNSIAIPPLEWIMQRLSEALKGGA